MLSGLKRGNTRWNARVQLKSFWSDRHLKKAVYPRGEGQDGGQFQNRERGCLGFGK